MPHSYGVSLTSDRRRDDSTLDAVNMPPMARAAKTAAMATAVQFWAKRFESNACRSRLAREGKRSEARVPGSTAPSIQSHRRTQYIIGRTGVSMEFVTRPKLDSGVAAPHFRRISPYFFGPLQQTATCSRPSRRLTKLTAEDAGR